MDGINFEITFTFNADGTYSLTADIFGETETVTGIYAADGSILILDSTESMSYSINGDTLIMEDGFATEYKRLN